MQSQLQAAESELEQTRTSHAASRSDLTALQANHTQARSDIERMQQENSMLEERAKDAENKVQLLLDQVEHSVDNYRRQSRMSDMATPVPNGTSSHSRNASTASEATTIDQYTPTGMQHHNNIGGGHTRSTSDGALSIASTTTSNADGRNSLALDSLASELETLRSHWETTNKNYRLSERFDFEHQQQQRGVGPARTTESLANWRKGLDIDEDDENSRPTTAQGPSSLTQNNVGKL